MRTIAIVLLVASCSAPPSPPRQTTPAAPARVYSRSSVLDVAAVLAPPVGRRAARVVVQGPGQLALVDGATPGAAGSPLDECSDLEVAVVDEHDGWVRIVERDTDVALALWIPADYLGDVVTQKTPDRKSVV